MLLRTSFTKRYSCLQRQDTPRCCLGQLGSKSAGFGLMPEIWRESLHVSVRPLKEIEKKRLAVSQKSHKSHTRTHHFCHSHLSFLPSLSLCGRQIDKKTSILKPRDKQLIIYAIVATKNLLCSQGIVHTHTHTLSL